MTARRRPSTSTPRPPTDPHGPLKALARKCAERGLSITDAVALFEALYLADALAMSGGTRTRAAEIAGVARETIYRRNGGGPRQKAAEITFKTRRTRPDIKV